jgi:hypothetical protein
MPYQFVLCSPATVNGSSIIEYFSDQADRGDTPHIVATEMKAMRFKTQAEAATKIPDFMEAKEGQRRAVRRSLGREENPIWAPQDYSPIYILPVE